MFLFEIDFIFFYVFFYFLYVATLDCKPRPASALLLSCFDCSVAMFDATYAVTQQLFFMVRTAMIYIFWPYLVGWPDSLFSVIRFFRRFSYKIADLFSYYCYFFYFFFFFFLSFFLFFLYISFSFFFLFFILRKGAVLFVLG